MTQSTLSGQLSHDEQGNIVAPAPVDHTGKICDHGNMEAQMRQAYKNAQKILGEFGATLNDVVEEVLYVTDMDKAFAAAVTVRRGGGATRIGGRDGALQRARTGCGCRCGVADPELSAVPRARAK